MNIEHDIDLLVLEFESWTLGTTTIQKTEPSSGIKVNRSVRIMINGSHLTVSN